MHSFSRILFVIIVALVVASSFLIDRKVSAVPPLTCTAPPPQMVSWWPGENNANDIVSGNNGTPQNGITFAAGKVGQGFSLAGYGNLSGNGDRILVGNPANLQLQDLTIEFWIKRSSSTILTNSPAAPGSDGGMLFAYGTGGYGFAILQSTNQLVLSHMEVSSVSSTATITDTNWHHVAVSKSGNQVTFFVDGVANSPVTYNPTFTFTTNAAIGARGDNNVQNAFFGSIDDLAIYNRGLSTAEIQSIFNADSAGKCHSCTPPPPGMVDWWPGEGNGNDIRGENNGTLQNGATFAAGKVEQAFSFDGVNDYVEVTGGVGDFGWSPFTVDFWMNSNSVGTNTFILGKNNANGALGWDIRLDNSRIEVVGVNSWGINITSDASATSNSWHHIALSSTDTTVNLYIDGVLKGTSPRSYITPTANPFRIGYAATDYFYGGTVFSGLLDEVEVFNRAISQSEIQAIYNAGTYGKCRPRCVTPPSGLVSWWDGDDDPFDRQGTNHGTPQNGATFGNGKVGRAFSFDGIDDRVEIANTPALEPAEMTIDAWIFVDPTADPTGTYGIASKYYAVSGERGYELFVGNTGKLTFRAGTINQTSATSTNNVVFGQWNHVAVTLNSSACTLYINGSPDGSGGPGVPAIEATSNPFVIGALGGDFGPAAYFKGLIDEVEVFNRALSASDIQALNNACFAGKCKKCLAPPSNMVGWWNGDANSNDSSGNSNNGTFEGTTSYKFGKVGQAFSFDGTTNDVKIPASSSLEVGAGGGLTIDLWINPNSATTSEPLVEWNNGAGPNEGTHLWISTMLSGDLFANLVDTSATVHIISSSGGVIVAGAYQHVALTYDKASGMATLYRNGVIVAGPTNLGTFTPQTSFDLYLGRRPAGDPPLVRYAGSMDEIEIFNRVLSQTEIQSIVAAGASGKCKSFPQPSPPPPVPNPDKASTMSANGIHAEAVETDNVGDAAVTVNNSNSPVGITNYQTLPINQVGPMPFGYNTPLEVADISTTKAFTGNAQVCFSLQSVNDQNTFNQLRVLHLEGNTLVNRTSSSVFASRLLCATAPTLSPFAIAQDANASPTAANATISGAIVTADGAPVAGVTVQLSGTENTETITDSNGNYSFANVETNGFYSVTPARVNYTFAPATRSFSLLGAHTDASFTASTNTGTGGFLHPLDTSGFFVRQQYLDFLGREPDSSGFNFWNGGILSCGSDASCTEVKRINTSAAFFLSIEFQETGYLVYRMYKTAYGDLPGAPVPVKFNEFLPDTSRIGQSVVVNQPGWEQTLEHNKQGFADEFASRTRFTALYGSMNDSQYVNALNQNAGDVLSASERDEVISSLTTRRRTRAQVLRIVAENPQLARREFNKAFVLMEYFGYLRRDPNSGPDRDFTGYDFWLAKLDQFNGNFSDAEMVKSFLLSGEYRGRFPR